MIFYYSLESSKLIVKTKNKNKKQKQTQKQKSKIKQKCCWLLCWLVSCSMMVAAMSSAT